MGPRPGTKTKPSAKNGDAAPWNAKPNAPPKAPEPEAHGRGTRQLKAVLFDFDDTLIDWSGVDLNWNEIEGEHVQRVARYLRSQLPSYDISTDSLVELYSRRTYDAWRHARTSLRAPLMPEILLTALVELGIPRDALDADAIMRAYDWQAVAGTCVYPDVPPALRLLRDKGIECGIVTNASKPMWMRDVELRDYGLMQYFSHCRLSAADVGYLKPNRRIFRAALDMLGTSAEETVFVGDNPVADIAGAQAMGMVAIMRRNPGAARSSKLARPQATLRSFVELPAILDDWYPKWRGSDA